MERNLFLKEKIPLGIYVHIPWCVEKCPYCDFNSHKLKSEKPPEIDYIKRLEHDMRQYAKLVAEREVRSIFFGGGTPSIMSGTGIKSIITLLNKYFKISKSVEITLEANPGTVDQQKFSEFKAAGVNRLSLGIQSFNDKLLVELGRIHDSNTARASIRAAQKVGFDNINIDIMYGLPNQSVSESKDDLYEALKFKTNHISWYQLTLEPNTIFYAKPPKIPSSDKIVEIEKHGHEIMARKDMYQYEISAWSKYGKNKCSHNYNIWQYGDYIGIGAGACGKITMDNNIIRTMQTKHPKQYIQGTHNVNDKIVPKKEYLFEFMLNHLRLKQPVEYKLITERTGILTTDFSVYLRSLDDKFINLSENKFELNEYGFKFYNDIVAEFMPEE